MSQRPSKWISLFHEFAKDARISSKEISSTDSRGVPLVMWESQKRTLDFIGQGLDDGIHTFYISKSRQLGITTATLLVDIFWSSMHPNLNGCLVTEHEQNREKNRATIVNYVNNFPPGFFGDEFSIIRNNRNVIEFSNGARLNLLVAGTKKKDSTAWAEGSGYTFAHLTECASYGDAAGLESLEESFAQSNPHRLFVYESTSKGMNHWRDRYLRGQKNPLTERSTFVGFWAGDTNRVERNDPRFALYGTYPATGEEREKVLAVRDQYGWTITPEQLAWIRWKNSNPSKDDGLLQQNQPWTADDSFVMTGSSFFQSRMVGIDMKGILDTPAGTVEEGGYGYTAYRYDLGSDFFDVKLVAIEDDDEADLIELKVWEEPDDEGWYVIGADPAYGRNEHKDRHAIEVYRCFADKIVQVAEYATNDVEAKHMAWVLAHLAGAYKNCIVNLEIGGPGRMIMMEWDHIVQLMRAEMNVDRVRSRNWEDALSQARWYLFSRPDTMGAGYAYNFETTTRTKGEIMHQYRGAFVTREIVIRSIALLEEMRIVVQDGDTIGAPESKSESCKDDRVFATALANRAWLNWVRPTMISQGQTWEREKQRQTGLVTPQTERINNQVFRFFRRQEDLAAMEPSAGPKWRTDRGL